MSVNQHGRYIYTRRHRQRLLPMTVRVLGYMFDGIAIGALCVACDQTPSVRTESASAAGDAAAANPTTQTMSAGSLAARAAQNPPTMITTTAKAGAAAAPSDGGAKPSGALAGTSAPAATSGGAGASAGTSSIGPAAGAAGAAMDPSSDACDHACLLDVMKGYQDALVAKDPAKLKVSAGVKYSENGVVQKFGETMVWKSVMSLVPDTILNFADTTEGNVASQFVYNDSSQKIYQVRLKVAKHEITEIETMIVMQGDQFFNPAGMKVEPIFLQEIPADKRMSRAELESITQLYLDYLEGKKRGPMVPFSETCKRYENGTVTASGLSSLNGQSWSFMLTRRILVIDEETGVTWGMFPFSQSSNTLVVGEAFKIIAGKLEMIQAVMTYMPPHGVWD